MLDDYAVEILFEHEVALTGEPYNGTVVLKVFSTLGISKILLHLNGQNRFTCGSDGKRIQGARELLKETISLYNHAAQKKRFTAGEYKFPFECKLKAELPDSSACRISESSIITEYTAAVDVILFDSSAPKRTCVCPFKVVNPRILLPCVISKAEEASVGAFFCFGGRGTIKWSVRTEYDSAAPNSEFPIALQIDNRESQKIVNGASVHLTRFVFFHVNPSFFKLYEEEVADQVVKQTVLPGSEGSISISFKIPNDLPGSTAFSPADLPRELDPSAVFPPFSISYTIKACVNIKNDFDPSTTFPIHMVKTHAVILDTPPGSRIAVSINS